MVSNHRFALTKWLDVVPADGLFDVRVSGYVKSSGRLRFRLNYSGTTSPLNGGKLYIAAVDADGRVHGQWSEVPEKRTYQLDITPVSYNNFYLLGWGDLVKTRGHKPVAGIFRRVSCMDYSLTEQVTGDTSIDGKPIYQITFHGTATATGNNQTVATPPTNLETYIQGWGNIKAGSVGQLIVPWVYPADFNQTVSFSANPKVVYINIGSTCPTPVEYWLTIQYTKTV
jgi:hypothetical protein